jgi:tetratricopeptide (TPR) repeat protein
MFFAFACSAIAATEQVKDMNVIEIAKAALRDGLWDLARSYAFKSDDESSKKIIVESFARQQDWENVLVHLPPRGTNDWVRYYRAMSLHNRGESTSAYQILKEIPFTDEYYKYLAALLEAKIYFNNKEFSNAGKILANIQPKDDEARLFFGEIYEACGETNISEKCWKEIIASTSATERVKSVAAVKLKDISILEKQLSNVVSVPVKHQLSLSLAVAYLNRLQKDDFETARKLVIEVSTQSPDTPGAKEAFVRLSQVSLRLGRIAESIHLLEQAMNIWPQLLRDYDVRHSRGIALMKMNKVQQAFNDFDFATTVAYNDVAKAESLYNKANAMIHLGEKKEAMKIFQEVVDKYPSTQTAKVLEQVLKVQKLEQKGDSLYKDFRFDESFNIYSEVMTLDGNRTSAMQYKQALCLYSKGSDLEAEKLMRSAAEGGYSDKVSPMLANLWLAKYFYNVENYLESQKFFLKYAETAMPDDSRSFAYLWAAKAAFAARDYLSAVKTVTLLVNNFESSSHRSEAFIVQGESLMELARYDEAILVFERLILFEKNTPPLKLHAQLRKADALFAMGADNPERYKQAFEAYKVVRNGEALTPSAKISISYKMARTLDKLALSNQAFDMYYTDVILAYRKYREASLSLDDEAKASFSKAAFILADEYENRGKNFQALHILEILSASDVPAAKEARRRIRLIKAKG